MSKVSQSTVTAARRSTGPARICATRKPAPRVSSVKALRRLDVGAGKPGADARLLEELAALRKKAQDFDGAMRTVSLDPALVRPSRWIHREHSAFDSPAFGRLKESIAATGRNAQPIVVREVDDGYEIVFGHRRHRACLELGLPVLAVVWDREMTAHEQFLALDAENREREDPSCLEQGRLYAAGLAAGLFPSQRRLAEAIGVTHTWVRKALAVAELPPSVIRAFPDPRKIQPSHAEAIRDALQCDERGVIDRAQALCLSGDISTHAALRIVDELTGAASIRIEPRPLVRQRPGLGQWRREANSKVVITLPAGVVTDDVMTRLAPLIASAVAFGGAVET